MTAEDVKASLERWMRVAQRGKQAAEKIESVTAPDDYTIQIALKEPFAPLLPLLALQTSAAIVLPAEKQAQPMTDFVGTGPFQFRERQPDQYVQLVRFDGYVPRDDAANMYGGRRVAYLDELRFVPVPNASTRIEGALSGLFLRRCPAGGIAAAPRGAGAGEADRAQAVRLAVHVFLCRAMYSRRAKIPLTLLDRIGHPGSASSQLGQTRLQQLPVVARMHAPLPAELARDQATTLDPPPDRLLHHPAALGDVGDAQQRLLEISRRQRHGHRAGMVRAASLDERPPLQGCPRVRRARAPPSQNKFGEIAGE